MEVDNNILVIVVQKLKGQFVGKKHALEKSIWLFISYDFGKN